MALLRTNPSRVVLLLVLGPLAATLVGCSILFPDDVGFDPQRTPSIPQMRAPTGQKEHVQGASAKAREIEQNLGYQ